MAKRHKRLRERLGETRQHGFEEFSALANSDPEMRIRGRLIELMSTAAVEGAQEARDGGADDGQILVDLAASAGFAVALILVQACDKTGWPALKAVLMQAIGEAFDQMFRSNGGARG